MAMNVSFYAPPLCWRCQTIDNKPQKRATVGFGIWTCI